MRGGGDVRISASPAGAIEARIRKLLADGKPRTEGEILVGLLADYRAALSAALPDVLAHAAFERQGKRWRGSSAGKSEAIRPSLGDTGRIFAELWASPGRTVTIAQRAVRLDWEARVAELRRCGVIVSLDEVAIHGGRYDASMFCQAPRAGGRAVAPDSA